jgi:hypothetical protein
MISASNRARVLNGEIGMWATKLKNSILRVSLSALAAYASADGVFSKDSSYTHGKGGDYATMQNDWPQRDTRE